MANFVREQSELQNIHIHSLFLHSHPVHSRINDGVPNCTALGKDLLMQITIHFSYYKMNFKCTRQYPFSLRVSPKQQNGTSNKQWSNKLGYYTEQQMLLEMYRKKSKRSSFWIAHGRLLFQGVVASELQVRTARNARVVHMVCFHPHTRLHGAASCAAYTHALDCMTKNQQQKN